MAEQTADMPNKWLVCEQAKPDEHAGAHSTRAQLAIYKKAAERRPETSQPPLQNEIVLRIAWLLHIRAVHAG